MSETRPAALTERPAPRARPTRRPQRRCLGWLLALGAALILAACAPTDPPPSPAAAAEAAYAAGQPAEAIPLFEAALAEATGPDAAHLRARLGLARFKAGQTDAALADLAAAIADPQALPLDVARAQRYQATVWVRQGHTDRALAALAAAAAYFEGQPAHAADLLKVRQVEAGLRWQAGELDAAFAAYQDLHGRAQVAGELRAQAAGLEGMAMVLSWAGDAEAAVELFDSACDLYDRAPAPEPALHCRANAAVAAVGGDAPARGLTLARAVISAAQAAGRPPVEAQAHTTAAWALARLGRTAEAAAEASEAEALAAAARLPRQATHARLARIVAAAADQDWATVDGHAAAVRADLPAGDPGQALLLGVLAERAAVGDPAAYTAALERAFAAFEAARGAVDAGLMGAFLAPARQRIYAALLTARLDLAGRPDPQGALDVLGAMKARAFTDRLASQRAPAPRGRRTPAVRVQRALVRARLGRHQWRPPPAAEALAALPADLVVLEHAALDGEVLSFLSFRGVTTVARVPVAAPALAQQVSALIARLRAGGAWRDQAAAVAHGALDPVLPALEAAVAAGATRLAVLPHGPLHAVPFEVLPWGDGLVVDRLAVFSAPSLGSLQRLLAAPRAPDAHTLLTVADAFSDLPGARAEAEQVAALYPEPTVLAGPQAGLAAVRGALAGAAVLHFAVHGVRPDPHSTAHLALRDGNLYAHDLASAPLAKAALVVLSVCDSARGEPTVGDEIVGVLDRAFLEAGARAVVASRWPVHDAASTLFMVRLHQARRAGASTLAALHQAQLALRHKRLGPSALPPALRDRLDPTRVRGVTPFRPSTPPVAFDHPYYWAGFSLRGDPR